MPKSRTKSKQALVKMKIRQKYKARLKRKKAEIKKAKATEPNVENAVS